MVDIQLSPCKELMKRVTFEKQFKVMDFDESLLDVTLKEINQNAGRKKALLKYNQFIKIGLNDWIYLTGAHNSGRSYFASVLSVDAAKRMKGPIYFLNSPKRIQELYDMSKNRNQELIKLEIISYLYNSFRSEEVFEQNVEALKIKRKRYLDNPFSN